MKTYNTIEEVKADIKNGVLEIDDDIEINFDGFEIDADIKCKNIYSKGEIRDIIACDINACDINACDINARNINARNINAWDINALYISYYAFCCVYNSIKCTSIKALRTNAHKLICLDGKLTIIEKEDDKTKKQSSC